MDDEMRQRKLIQEQIERAREEGERRRREVAAQQAGGDEGAEMPEGGVEAAIGTAPEVTNELKRDEGEKLSLNLSFKASQPTGAASSKEPSPRGSTSPPAAVPAETSSTVETASTAEPAPAPAVPKSTFIAPPPKPVIGFTPKANPFAAKPNPLKGNPLKRPNPLKSGSSASSSVGGEKRKAPLSAVEQIAMEEMARKQRRMA